MAVNVTTKDFLFKVFRRGGEGIEPIRFKVISTVKQ